jgi:hypothetical protein
VPVDPAETCKLQSWELRRCAAYVVVLVLYSTVSVPLRCSLFLCWSEVDLAKLASRPLETRSLEYYMPLSDCRQIGSGLRYEIRYTGYDRSGHTIEVYRLQ